MLFRTESCFHFQTKGQSDTSYFALCEEKVQEVWNWKILIAGVYHYQNKIIQYLHILRGKCLTWQERERERLFYNWLTEGQLVLWCESFKWLFVSAKLLWTSFVQSDTLPMKHFKALHICWIERERQTEGEGERESGWIIPVTNVL